MSDEYKHAVDHQNRATDAEINAVLDKFDEPVNWNHVKAISIRTAVEQEIATWLRHEASRDSDRIAAAISSGTYRKPAQEASE